MSCQASYWHLNIWRCLFLHLQQQACLQRLPRHLPAGFPRPLEVSRKPRGWAARKCRKMTFSESAQNHFPGLPRASGASVGQNLAGKFRIGHERVREASVRAETLCHESCAPQDASRVPRLAKSQKINQKTWFSAIFGPQALSGHIFRCAAGWREALITLVPS